MASEISCERCVTVLFFKNDEFMYDPFAGLLNPNELRYTSYFTSNVDIFWGSWSSAVEQSSRMYRTKTTEISLKGYVCFPLETMFAAVLTKCRVCHPLCGDHWCYFAGLQLGGSRIGGIDDVMMIENGAASSSAPSVPSSLWVLQSLSFTLPTTHLPLDTENRDRNDT